MNNSPNNKQSLQLVDGGSNTGKNNSISISEKAKEIGIDFLDKAPEKIGNGVLSLIPKDVAAKNGIVPFEQTDEVIKVGMLNPQNIDALNALRFIAEEQKKEVNTYLISQSVFDDIYKQYEGPSEMIKEAVESFKGDELDFESDGGEKKQKKGEKQEILQEAPVAKLVQVIISHAIDGHASDIHIEPMESDYRVRFRVDGILHVSLIIPKSLGPVVVSRIKILANLKIDEKRKPQDGRFRITDKKGKSIDFRVSTLPVINGEKVVMRILDKDKGLTDLSSLGMLGTAQKHLKEAIEETYGMILMTGPTGSGKSTTLYAILKILNQEERNIITLEDPVEYNIEGLNQSQVKPAIGYTFASGLRTILRQDPNVIMVGEIRDSETAELAVHAALTGHLMFSTLHTNTAIGAIPRLVDMGIEPFLLGSSLRMVMSQRLARKICEECKEEREISEKIKGNLLEVIKDVSEEERKKYGVDLSQGVKVFQGKGCDACNGTGLKGRIAIYEIVPVTDSMRNVIAEKDGDEAILIEEQKKEKIVTMKQDGILKILKGLTTIEEIERITEGNISLEEELI